MSKCGIWKICIQQIHIEVRNVTLSWYKMILRWRNIYHHCLVLSVHSNWNLTSLVNYWLKFYKFLYPRFALDCVSAHHDVVECISCHPTEPALFLSCSAVSRNFLSVFITFQNNLKKKAQLPVTNKKNMLISLTQKYAQVLTVDDTVSA